MLYTSVSNPILFVRQLAQRNVCPVGCSYGKQRKQQPKAAAVGRVSRLFGSFTCLIGQIAHILVPFSAIQPACLPAYIRGQAKFGV